MDRVHGFRAGGAGNRQDARSHVQKPRQGDLPSADPMALGDFGECRVFVRTSDASMPADGAVGNAGDTVGVTALCQPSIQRRLIKEINGILNGRYRHDVEGCVQVLFLDVAQSDMPDFAFFQEPPELAETVFKWNFGIHHV